MSPSSAGLASPDSLSAAAARLAGAGRTIGVAPHEAEAGCSRDAGLADEVVVADARDPLALRDAVTGGRRAGGRHRGLRRRARAARAARSCPPPPAGTVIFFSMATSFSAAALGAEGLAADVTMLVGNGFVPGHAAYAIDLLRTSDGVRALFERRLLMAPRHGTRPPRWSKLDLDPADGPQGAHPGPQVGKPIVDLAQQHTTVSVERATLRLAGLSGADAEGTPWVNRLLDAVRADVGLEHGISLPVWDALLRGEAEDLTTLAQKAAAGSVPFRLPEGRDADPRRRGGAQAGRRRACAGSTRAARERERLIARIGDAPRQPWIYLIVATGDIHEDIPQAQQAAREGADVIAVIRSTGQSLLDYVPEGATREGFAGTYATQENFRLMRAALDESSKELGRYVRLTNYASGLCMPEIAALAGLERLDMMLNDSMYGILFRDINPIRTFVDQRFSRQVHARAGIIINTGEDNYLTTADAVEAAHTVTGPSSSTSTSPRRPGSRTGSSAWATRSRSTRRSRTRSGWSWPTRCSPASCSRRRR